MNGCGMRYGNWIWEWDWNHMALSTQTVEMAMTKCLTQTTM